MNEQPPPVDTAPLGQGPLPPESDELGDTIVDMLGDAMHHMAAMERSRRRARIALTIALVILAIVAGLRLYHYAISHTPDALLIERMRHQHGPYG